MPTAEGFLTITEVAARAGVPSASVTPAWVKKCEREGLVDTHGETLRGRPATYPELAAKQARNAKFLREIGIGLTEILNIRRREEKLLPTLDRIFSQNQDRGTAKFYLYFFEDRYGEVNEKALEVLKPDEIDRLQKHQQISASIGKIVKIRWDFLKRVSEAHHDNFEVINRKLIIRMKE